MFADARSPSSFPFHFTPTLCSWLNVAEGFFAKLTKARLDRDVFGPSIFGPIGRGDE
jgi:hypothetical protein